MGWVWWYTPVILALGRLRQEKEVSSRAIGRDPASKKKEEWICS
jgi:hypothetical protein